MMASLKFALLLSVSLYGSGKTMMILLTLLCEHEYNYFLKCMMKKTSDRKNYSEDYFDY